MKRLSNSLVVCKIRPLCFVSFCRNVISFNQMFHDAAAYASRCIENEILMYLRRNSKRKTEVSIDEPLNVDWDGNELLLSDILGTDEDMVYRDMEEEAERRQLSNALSKLPSRERRIVELRYGINTDDDREMTQKEVADLMGISQSYISRLEKKIMNRLRKDLVRYG